MTDRVRGRTELIIRLAASESCGDATTCLIRGRFVVRDVTRSAPPLVTPRLPPAVAAWAAVGFAFAKPPGSCKFESEIVIPGVFPIHLREYRQDLDRTLVVSLFNGSDPRRPNVNCIALGCPGRTLPLGAAANAWLSLHSGTMPKKKAGKVSDEE